MKLNNQDLLKPSIDYYENREVHGDYQYITLEEIVNNFMMSRDDDDYTANVQRFKVLYHARRCLRDLNYNVLREIRRISLELSPTLQVTLPPDYINYVRISWVDQAGQLHPLSIDDRMDVSREYLQDDKYEYLYNDEGNVMIGDRTNRDYFYPHYPKERFDENYCLSHGYRKQHFCNGGFRPNTDASRLFANGRYNINKQEGIIQFGSEVHGREIVLEYISDGLFTGAEGLSETDFRVHKFAENAMYSYIFYELIKNRRNVPANQKMLARKEYYNHRRLCKLKVNTLRKDEILQSFRKASTWIK